MKKAIILLVGLGLMALALKSVAQVSINGALSDTNNTGYGPSFVESYLVEYRSCDKDGEPVKGNRKADGLAWDDPLCPSVARVVSGLVAIDKSYVLPGNLRNRTNLFLVVIYDHFPRDPAISRQGFSDREMKYSFDHGPWTNMKRSESGKWYFRYPLNDLTCRGYVLAFWNHFRSGLIEDKAGGIRWNAHKGGDYITDFRVFQVMAYNEDREDDDAIGRWQAIKAGELAIGPAALQASNGGVGVYNSVEKVFATLPALPTSSDSGATATAKATAEADGVKATAKATAKADQGSSEENDVREVPDTSSDREGDSNGDSDVSEAPANNHRDDQGDHRSPNPVEVFPYTLKNGDPGVKILASEDLDDPVKLTIDYGERYRDAKTGQRRVKRTLDPGRWLAVAYNPGLSFVAVVCDSRGREIARQEISVAKVRRITKEGEN